MPSASRLLKGAEVRARAALAGKGGARPGSEAAPLQSTELASAMAVRLQSPWACCQPLELVVAAVGCVLQGSVSSGRAVQPGDWPLGTLQGAEGPGTLRVCGAGGPGVAR